MKWKAIYTIPCEPRDITITIPFEYDGTHEEAKKYAENPNTCLLPQHFIFARPKKTIVICDEQEPINESNFEEIAEITKPISYTPKMLILKDCIIQTGTKSNLSNVKLNNLN